MMVRHCLKGRAVHHQLIVETFPSLASLKKFLSSPEVRVPRPEKSIVVPQKVLFRDEKYTDENIQILCQYIHDCKLTGNPQVAISNALTIIWVLLDLYSVFNKEKCVTNRFL